MKYLISILLLSAVAFAWGVSSSASPAYLDTGESMLFYTSIQNMMGNETVTVDVSFEGNTNITWLDNKTDECEPEWSDTNKRTYVLPPQTKKCPVYVNVTIPLGTPVGTSYPFKIHYQEVIENCTGMCFLKAYSLNKEVIVVDSIPPVFNNYTIKCSERAGIVRLLPNYQSNLVGKSLKCKLTANATDYWGISDVWVNVTKPNNATESVSFNLSNGIYDGTYSISTNGTHKFLLVSKDANNNTANVSIDVQTDLNQTPILWKWVWNKTDGIVAGLPQSRYKLIYWDTSMEFNATISGFYVDEHATSAMFDNASYPIGGSKIDVFASISNHTLWDNTMLEVPITKDEGNWEQDLSKESTIAQQFIYKIVNGTNTQDVGFTNVNATTSCKENFTCDKTSWIFNVSANSDWEKTAKAQGNVIQLINTSKIENKIWKQDVTVNNTEEGITFYNLTVWLYLNDSVATKIPETEYLKVEGTDITPQNSTDDCNSSSPTYSNFTISNELWRVCRQDLDGNNVTEFFKIIQPHTSSVSYELGIELQRENGSSCVENIECLSGICCNNVCRGECPYCGDGVCEGGETCSSCYDDCGLCSAPTTTSVTIVPAWEETENVTEEIKENITEEKMKNKTTCKLGCELEFDGEEDYVNITSEEDVNITVSEEEGNYTEALKVAKTIQEPEIKAELVDYVVILLVIFFLFVASAYPLMFHV